MRKHEEVPSAGWLSNDEIEDWLKKCLTCSHCYKLKRDDEEIHCRLKRGCEYKEYKPKNRK